MHVNQKYEINPNFFRVIDSEEKAYWLGFIAADGNVYTDNGKNIFQIDLQEQDGQHLYKLRDCLGSTHPIKTKINNLNDVVCYLHITNKELVANLLSLGITPRKSFTIQPWEGPPELLSHYWRGYFDGNGTISYIDKKKGGYETGITSGSTALLEAYVSFIKINTSFNLNITHDRSVFRVRCGGKRKPQIVLGTFYSNPSIYLDRKKLLVDSLFSMVPHRQDWSWITLEYIENKTKELGSYVALAKELGMNKTGISQIVKRLSR